MNTTGDYDSTSGTLTFTGTALETQTINVTVNGDLLVELDENYFVNLSNIQAGGQAVTFADDQGEGTIIDDDSATLSINDLSINEGHSGTRTIMFDVTLDAEVDTGLTVDYATADGTATLLDNDYQATSGTRAFVGLPGETQQISVLVNGRYEELAVPQFAEERSHARELLAKKHHWWLNALAERRVSAEDQEVEPLFFRILYDDRSAMGNLAVS